jgi:bifunctional polynucleotide phosphatase/kinase
MYIIMVTNCFRKTTFYYKYFAPHGYEHVSRDALHNVQTCINFAINALKEGKSVVIDNTNPDNDVRTNYLKLARDAGVRARCFQFTAPRMFIIQK